MSITPPPAARALATPGTLTLLARGRFPLGRGCIFAIIPFARIFNFHLGLRWRSSPAESGDAELSYVAHDGPQAFPSPAIATIATGRSRPAGDTAASATTRIVRLGSTAGSIPHIICVETRWVSSRAISSQGGS
eukprot:scaffold166458_cov56-Cyclotella_meneghiniana.AAC.2